MMSRRILKLNLAFVFFFAFSARVFKCFRLFVLLFANFVILLMELHAVTCLENLLGQKEKAGMTIPDHLQLPRSPNTKPEAKRTSEVKPKNLMLKKFIVRNKIQLPNVHKW